MTENQYAQIQSKIQEIEENSKDGKIVLFFESGSLKNIEVIHREKAYTSNT